MVIWIEEGVLIWIFRRKNDPFDLLIGL